MVVGIEFIAVLVKEGSQNVRSFAAAKECADFGMGKIVEGRGLHGGSSVMGEPDALD
jgi:hypothetical protein